MSNSRFDAHSNDPIRRRYVSFEIEVDKRDDMTTEQQTSEKDDDRGKSFHQNERRAVFAYATVGLFYLLIWVFVYYRTNSYPTPKSETDSLSEEFRERNARRYLDGIVSHGPRVFGSEANKNAQKYIRKVIQDIKDNKTSYMDIEISEQKVNGSFTLDSSHYTSVYMGLTNLVVKVSPLQKVGRSLLISCHYDTGVDSPGAGDAAENCAVMMEILRALSQSRANFLNNIIFLFNSAEEDFLQASHAFITRHPWASTVRAFINQDSGGSGGWEMLSRIVPGYPRILKAYIEAARYPYATVISQEMFETGQVPGETDFRIFMDYGHIPGLDILHTKNGYVYHTKNDNSSFIPPGCMQRGGENLMAVLVHIANLSDLGSLVEDPQGSMVYFDFMGYFMITYSKGMGTWISVATCIFVCVGAFMRAYSVVIELGAQSLLPQIGALLTVSLTWVICLAVPMVMALFLVTNGHSLSFYTHTVNIMWLFILPSITAVLTFHAILKKTIFKNTDAERLVVMLQDCHLLLLLLVTLVMTYYGILSAYVPLMCVICPALFYTVLNTCGFKPTGVFYSLYSTLIPSIYILYLSQNLLTSFIPVTGRIGMYGSPDEFIAVLAALPVVACLPYHVGYVYTHKQMNQVIYPLAAITSVMVAIVIFTNVGFPYSDHPQDASKQRAIFVHFDRRFHSRTGEVVHSGTHIWYKPKDNNGATMLKSHAPELFNTARSAVCEGMLCGRPYLPPVLTYDTRGTYDFPASHLKVPRVNVELTDRTQLNDTNIRFHFRMSGPSHVTIFLTSLDNTKVIEWKFEPNFTVKANRLAYGNYWSYFAFLINAESSYPVWQFSVDVQMTEKKKMNSSLFQIVCSGHYLHGPNQVSQDLLALEEKLPPWMETLRWLAVYDVYKF